MALANLFISNSAAIQIPVGIYGNASLKWIFFFLKKGPKPEYLLPTYCTLKPNYTSNCASAHSRAFILVFSQGKLKKKKNLYQEVRQYHTELKEQLLGPSVKIIVIDDIISELNA